MFFTSLSELERVLHGHSCAFRQLELIADTKASFNNQFGEWLVTTKGCSAAAGWGVAIDELAKTQDVDPIALFFELVEEFLTVWARR